MKSGVQSSEFWMTALFAVAYLLNGTALINIPWNEMLALAGVCGVYTGGRSYVKAKTGGK